MIGGHLNHHPAIAILRSFMQVAKNSTFGDMSLHSLSAKEMYLKQSQKRDMYSNPSTENLSVSGFLVQFAKSTTTNTRGLSFHVELELQTPRMVGEDMHSFVKS